MSLAHDMEVFYEENYPKPPSEEVEYAALHPVERELVGQFEDAVAGLSLAGIARLSSGRNLPRTIGEYRLAAITPLRGFIKPTIEEMGFWGRMPQDIKREYPGSISKEPYIDSSLGIGFVYQDRLVAISSAGVPIDDETEPDTLLITQLQAVHKRIRRKKDRFATGLHAGILWRDTLVESWASVARTAGLGRLGILGAAKNPWLRAAHKDNFVRGYDEVAERMGFTEAADRNWYKEL